jgi:hypothetical protein
MPKPILCLDLDGVIHSYEHGWKGGVIYGTVVPGFFEWVVKTRDHFELVIYSSRSKSAEGLAAMKDWLGMQLITWKSAPNIRDIASTPYLDDFKFAHEKPPAFLTIDDRALTFNGRWDDYGYSPAALRSFKPWNAR